MMTDLELFEHAVEQAKFIAYWRARADAAGRSEKVGCLRGPHDLSRRQCLVRARHGEWRIVDLAIAAEVRARGELDDRATPTDSA